MSGQHACSLYTIYCAPLLKEIRISLKSSLSTQSVCHTIIPESESDYRVPQKMRTLYPCPYCYLLEKRMKTRGRHVVTVNYSSGHSKHLSVSNHFISVPRDSRSILVPHFCFETTDSEIIDRNRSETIICKVTDTNLQMKLSSRLQCSPLSSFGHMSRTYSAGRF